jgi:putative serine protease PepD
MLDGSRLMRRRRPGTAGRTSTEERVVMEKSDSRGRGRRRAVLVGVPFAAGALAGAAVLAGVWGLNTSAGPATGATPLPSASRSAVARTVAQYDAETIYKLDSPGVVDISVTEQVPQVAPRGLWPFMPGGGAEQAEGSGFVYDKSGDIVTAAHVVSGATKISVTFSDGKTASATLVGTDPSSDTAVIKVDVPVGELTPLVLGDSATVAPGEGVVAIGSPFGYPDSISAGIVSAVGRGIQAPNGYTIPNAVQTDAAINHGNSGGPLIDPSGDVVGVNVQIATDSFSDNSGVGFAVPSNTVKSVVSSLIAGKSVEYPYLGISVGSSASRDGAKVGTVTPGSPAATAGLRAGDVVTAVDGTTIANADQLTNLISQHQPGDKIHLTIERNGSSVTLDATLGTRPATRTA